MTAARRGGLSNAGIGADIDSTATAVLQIDLGALAANYKKFQSLAPGAECAAVVKADAYGTGAERAGPALEAAGCRTFFVATFDEAKSLRSVLPKAAIYVLDGLFANSAAELTKYDLRPALGSKTEIEEWAAHCKVQGQSLAAAIHIDTGMNRLGLNAAEVQALAADPSPFQVFKPVLVMSHLACADEPKHPKNAEQRALFETLRTKLPSAPASFANSAGILLGKDYHYHLLRPGIGLYGGNPLADAPNPMRCVVGLNVRIAQIRHARRGETVGYGATRTLKRDTIIATIAAGYADGVPRRLSESDERAGGVAYIGEHRVPILGRVSMDLITLDVTDVPVELARRGAFVELLGPHVSVDDMAAPAQTIGYEVLTRLGRRYQRVYSQG